MSIHVIYQTNDESQSLLLGGRPSDPPTGLQDYSDASGTFTPHDPRIAVGAIPTHDAKAAAASPITGYSLMLVAAMLQSTYAVIIQSAEMHYGMPPSATVTITSFLTILYSLTAITYLRIWTTMPLTISHFLRVFVQGLLTAYSVFANSISYASIPAGTVVTINSGGPAVTSVLAALFLGDSFTKKDIIALLVNFVGVGLVAQPSAESDGKDVGFAVTNLLISIVAFSASVCIVKAMGSRIHFLFHMLSYGVGTLPFSLAMTKREDFAKLLGGGFGTVLLAIGVSLSFVSQSVFCYGIQICRPGPAFLIRTFSVPFSFLLAFLILGEGLSAVTLSGAFLVCSSLVFVGVSATLQHGWEKRHSHDLDDVASAPACNV